MNTNLKNKSFEQYKRIFKFSEILITLDVMGGLFGVIWYKYLNTLNQIPFIGKGNFMEIAVYVVATLLLIQIFDGFEVGFYTALNAVLSQVLAMLCVNTVMAVQTILTVGYLYHIGAILLAYLILFIVQIVASIILVNLFETLYVKLFPAWDILVVYENDDVQLFLDKVNTRKDKYVVGDVVKITAGYDEICKKMMEHRSVILYDISSELRNDLLKFCYGEEIRVYQTPKLSDIIIRSAKEHHLFDTPLLMSNNIGLTFEQKLIKRVIDVVISLLMLVITSPVMLVTAIIIKLEDHGPVFFTQERVTLNDKSFTIYKFRSMIVDAEEEGKAKPATSDDDRITKIGRFIRKTRIDELPQLINVLKGDMSLVGPRPERIEHVRKYTELIPEFKYRTKVKGGLTGYAQVYGKYNTTAYDKLKLDLMYIENYSLALDFQITIKTLKVLFMKSSTEGFSQNNIITQSYGISQNSESESSKRSEN